MGNASVIRCLYTPAQKLKKNIFDVSGVNELAVHFSAWGEEPCDAPYHSGGTYPDCPRVIGTAYGDHIVVGDPKLTTGLVANNRLSRKSTINLREIAVRRDNGIIRFDVPAVRENSGLFSIYSLSGKMLWQTRVQQYSQKVECHCPNLPSECCIVEFIDGSRIVESMKVLLPPR